MEVVHDHDHVKSCGRQRNACSFEIDRLRRDAHTETIDVLAEVGERSWIAIDCQRLQTALCQPDGVSAAAAGDIERSARAGQQMSMIDQPGCWFHRCWRPFYGAPIALATA